MSYAYGRIRVLVVEDEAYTRNTTKRLLHQCGVRDVLEASDGAEGFSLLLGSKPHVVFCDIHMEPVGGMEFLRMVRESTGEDISGTHVVFLTADAMKDTVLAARDLRIDGYLVKPANILRIKARLDEYLARNPDTR
ncbi:MAG: response regulator [Alphaproteobacteria bacterium]